MKEKKNFDSSRQIRWGVILNYVYTAFNLVMGLVYTPWMIQEIGQSDYAIYGVATSVVSMLTLDFGLGSAVTRFVAKYRAEKKEEKIADFMGMVFKLFLILDLVIGLALVIVYFLMNQIYASFTPVEIERLRVSYLMIGLFTLITFPFQPLNGLLTANERFIFQKLVDVLQKAVCILLTFIALVNGKGLYALVFLNVFMSFLSIIVKWIYAKKEKILQVHYSSWDRSLVKEILGFSIWTTVILIFQRMILNIMPTILGATAGSSEVAVYNVAFSIYGYVYSAISVFGGLMLPRITNSIYGGSKDSGRELTDIMIKVGRIQMLMIGAFVSIYAILGRQFIHIWVGEDYDGAFIVSLFIIIPIVIAETESVAYGALTAMGRLKIQALAIAAEGICASGVAYILSAKIGALGAGIGICMGYLTGHIFIMNYYYKKTAHIAIGEFFRETLLKSVLPIVFTMAAAFGMEHLIAPKGWISMFINIIIDCCIYLIAAWFLWLNEYEKSIIKKPFDRILRRQ